MQEDHTVTHIGFVGVIAEKSSRLLEDVLSREEQRVADAERDILSQWQEHLMESVRHLKICWIRKAESTIIRAYTRSGIA